MENFNLKKFLVENKLTNNSKMLNEVQLDSKNQKIKDNVLYLNYENSPVFGKLTSKEFKVTIAGPKDNPKNQKYMIYWKEDTPNWEWEAGNMKPRLRNSIIAKAKKLIPIK